MEKKVYLFSLIFSFTCFNVKIWSTPPSPNAPWFSQIIFSPTRCTFFNKNFDTYFPESNQESNSHIVFIELSFYFPYLYIDAFYSFPPILRNYIFSKFFLYHFQIQSITNSTPYSIISPVIPSSPTNLLFFNFITPNYHHPYHPYQLFNSITPTPYFTYSIFYI